MSSEHSSTPRAGDRPMLHAVDWAVQAGVADEIMINTRRLVRRRRQRRLAMGGALAAVAVGAFLWFSPVARRAVPADGASMVLTLPATRILPDGSKVELKEGAEISVAYSTATRRVALLRGEAHFEVMPNKARPFIVAVDAVEVRAVGTAFSVQRGSANVEVLVTKGRVAVDRVAEKTAAQPSATQTIAMLDAGHHTQVDVAPTAAPPIVQEVSAEEMQQRLAWRAPRLEFTRTPLSEAIAMINQHSAIKVSLADPSLGAVRISGLLHVDNVESLLRLLELEHGITAEKRDDGEVVLRPGR